MKSLLFTSKVIQSLNSKTRTYTVWDTQVPALGVRVYTDGRRFYVTHLSIPNKTLAAVGQLTLKKVRQHVRALQASFLDKETKPIRLIRFDALVKEEWTDKVCKGWRAQGAPAGGTSQLGRQHLSLQGGRRAALHARHQRVGGVARCAGLADRLSPRGAPGYPGHAGARDAGGARTA